MKKIGIFYGSTTGTTESVARVIAKKLGVDDTALHDVANIQKEWILSSDILLLGTSTWGDGELLDDWYEALKLFAGMDLKGKTVALFGCGDSSAYSDTFCDGLAELHEGLKDTGCTFCGAFPADGYTYDDSKAVVDRTFVGLAIDDTNESNQTATQIDQWINILNNECLG